MCLWGFAVLLHLLQSLPFTFCTEDFIKFCWGLLICNAFTVFFMWWKQTSVSIMLRVAELTSSVSLYWEWKYIYPSFHKLPPPTSVSIRIKSRSAFMDTRSILMTDRFVKNIQRSEIEYRWPYFLFSFISTTLLTYSNVYCCYNLAIENLIIFT